MQHRQQEILKLLESKGVIQTEDLTQIFGASEATIRRDLAAMQEMGLLIRTFGGAQLPVEQSLVAKTFEEKSRLLRNEKNAIGKKAAEMIEPGMVITLDGGTTLWSIYDLLKKKKPLTVLTSALSVIEQLGSVDGITIYCSGGKVRPKSLDFTGPNVIEMYTKARADVALIGTDSYIPGSGAFADDAESASITRAAAKCADKKVLVLDHSKFTNKGCSKILEPSEIDFLITDSGITGETRQRLERDPFKLIIVEPSQERNSIESSIK